MPWPRTIYGLTSARDDEIRYVGLTSGELPTRLREHVLAAQKTAKDRWIEGLVRGGVGVRIVELEITHDADPHVAEEDWIRRLWRNGRLLNPKLPLGLARRPKKNPWGRL